MYYVESTRYNNTRTIGECVSRKDANALVKKEIDRMKAKGITKIGEFYIRCGEKELNGKMRVKNKKNTYAMMK